MFAPYRRAWSATGSSTTRGAAPRESGAGPVTKIAAAVHRFPERELEIHRLHQHDPEFAAVCEDLADALAALEHWRAVGAGARVEEYRDLVDELAAEVLAALDARRCDKNVPGA